MLLSTASCSTIQEKLGIPSPTKNFSFKFYFFTKEAAQDKAKEFQSRYNGTIDDMVALADNPDYAKAEEKRLKLVAEANSLASQFKDLSNKLQGNLNTLTNETRSQPTK